MRALIALVLAVPGLALAVDPLHVEPLDPSTGSGPGPAPIIHGEEAPRDLFPMTGGMLFGGKLAGGTEPLKMFACSSTLIAPDVVLLAAHCVDMETMLALSGLNVELEDPAYAWSRQADLSAYQFTPRDWPDDVVFATEVLAHPDFSLYGMGLGLSENFDIALMFLEEPVLDVPVAILPTVAENATLVEGQTLDIVGWGQQTSARQPPPDTYGHKMWGSSFIAEIDDFEFQVGAVEDDVRKCHGDSGGPSFAYVDTLSAEDMRLVGVTSHSYDLSDCREKGGVDTRVGYYLDWIDAEMRARCEDGTRVWCETPGIIPPPEADPMASDDPAQPVDSEEAAAACGCSAAGPSPGGLLVLLAAFFARRTSRIPRSASTRRPRR